MDNSRNADLLYLNLVIQILSKGNDKMDRTGFGTLSLFQHQMRIDISGANFPLLTTKRMSFKNIAEELFWFLKGETNSKTLSEKGVKIWDANAEKTGGDLGPIYGYQWNHFGAQYVDCKTDYKDQGVNQIDKAISMIKNDPNSRRIIVCAWNPVDIEKMALPPCHILFQFYVHDGKLDCGMYQRSADVGLGLPYNIASYALLTKMVASVTGTEANELIINTGDTHIYNNHIEPLKEQIKRSPKGNPRLVIKKLKTEIRDYCLEDFEIENYDPHPAVKMDMNV